MNIEELLKRNDTPVEKLRIKVARYADAIGWHLGKWQSTHSITYALYRGDRPDKLWYNIEKRLLRPDIEHQILEWAVFKAAYPGQQKTEMCAEYKALMKLAKD